MLNPAVKRETYSDLRSQLPAQLPAFLLEQRWFGGKARRIVSTEIDDIIEVRSGKIESIVVLVGVKFTEGAKEHYVLPLVPVAAPGTQDIGPASLKIADAESGRSLVLDNALESKDFLEYLLQLIANKAVFSGERGELRGHRGGAFALPQLHSVGPLKVKLLKGEQSNSSVVYGDRLILKFFRRIEEGINPDLEMNSFLTERAHYQHIPAPAGFIEYRSNGKSSTQAILQTFVRNEGDAWKYTQRSLVKFYEVAQRASRGNAGRAEDQVDHATREAIGAYLKSVALLGRRTAELHVALASDSDDPAFLPEPFTVDFQKSFETALLRMNRDVLGLLREKISGLPELWQAKAQAVAHHEGEISNRFRVSLREPIKGTRIRIHGDYHLGQVLYTGSDFVIIDFEGEPARPLSERRVKRSPLQDVAGMLRSFHYAAFAPLLGTSGNKTMDATRFGQMRLWAECWNTQVADAFLAEYFKTCGAAPFLPANAAETSKLLELYVLEKAVYELGYELNNRPDWVGLPLEGISKLLAI